MRKYPVNARYLDTKTKRLAKEFEMFEKKPMLGICELITKNELDNDGHSKINKIEAFIYGQPNTIYDGYKFGVTIDLGELYPFKPTSIYFASAIKHINVFNRVISPIFVDHLDPNSHDLKDMLHSLILLLNEPDIQNPMDIELAQMYVNNKSLYEECIREHCEKYALKV